MINFNEFVAAQQNVAAANLNQFITEAATNGFTLSKPKGAPGVVFLSKSGKPQMLLINKEGKRIYVRISSALDAELKGGSKIDIAKAPVYAVALDNGGKMLVVGLAAEAQEFEAVDIKAAFGAAYTVA